MRSRRVLVGEVGPAHHRVEVRLEEPCDCGLCFSCELRSLRARTQGETPDDVLQADRLDFQVARRAAYAMAGVL